MPIHDLIQPGVFSPELVSLMGNVFEEVLKTLGLTGCDEPVTRLAAHRVIALVRSGERDPERIKQLTIESVKGPGFRPLG